MYSRGIFIDVFVFDSVPSNNENLMNAMVADTDAASCWLAMQIHFPT